MELSVYPAIVIRDLGDAIKSDLPVLIEGETGTGKSRLARHVHDSGLRRKGPWVRVDCTTLPENLIESELFGVARGAFTDAKVPRAGLIERATRGALFLGELA